MANPQFNPVPSESETWRQIPGYEGYYSVSDLGRVRRDVGGKGLCKAGRILRPTTTRKGYFIVGLCRDGQPRSFAVHKLVSVAFLGACPPGMQCNHIDGVKQNNRLGNLEYVSPSENIRHAFRLGLNVTTCGMRNNHAKLTDAGIHSIREMRNQGMKLQEIGRIFGIAQTTVSAILHQITWAHIALAPTSPSPDKLLELRAQTHVRGETMASSKLRDADIPIIRRLIAEGFTNTKIGKRFGVHNSQISRIRSGERWTHVTGIEPADPLV